jgi:hypothetical protein
MSLELAIYYLVDNSMARALTSSRKSISLDKTLFLFALSMMLLALPDLVRAQTYGASSHSVRVTVATINNLSLSSGTVSMTIDAASAVAGQNLMGPVVSSGTSLLWGVNSSNKKITATTSLASPMFTLRLVAVAPTPPASAAGEAPLSTLGADLLTNVGKSTGSATLQYTGTALASSGSGTDTHLVTFTITNQ